MKFKQINFNKIVIISFIIIGIGKLSDAETEEQTTTNTSTTAATNSLWNDNSIDRLKRDLLKSYDKYSNPTSKPVITLCVNPRNINLDEHNGIFKIYLWLVMQWKDPHLVWDPKEYNNITSVNLGGHEIWEPEIVSFNSIDPLAESYPDTLIIAQHDGSMLRVPPHEYNVFCDLNFSLWPYDKQNCSIKLGTWVSRDIKVMASDTKSCIEEDYADIIVNEWLLEKKYIRNGTDPQTKYEYAEFGFEMQRQSPLYKSIIITPTSCIVIMILSGFWLPPQCGEKILLNGISALLILAFLMYFGQLLPILADHTPLIVVFLSSSLILASFSMVISVAVIYIADINHEKRLPVWLRNILNGPLGKVFCLSYLNKNPAQICNDDDEPKTDGNSSQEPQIFELSPSNVSTNTIQNDWIILATAIDRLFFFIYCIIFIVLAFKYSV